MKKLLVISSALISAFIFSAIQIGKKTARNKLANNYSTSNNIDEEIKKVAYELWQAEGEPDGQAAKHWEQARMLVASIDKGTLNRNSPTV